MREETQQVPICAICKQAITAEQLPSMQLESCERVHVTCYLDATDKDDKRKPSH